MKVLLFTKQLVMISETLLNIEDWIKEAENTQNAITWINCLDNPLIHPWIHTYIHTHVSLYACMCVYKHAFISTFTVWITSKWTYAHNTATAGFAFAMNSSLINVSAIPIRTSFPNQIMFHNREAHLRDFMLSCIRPQMASKKQTLGQKVD